MLQTMHERVEDLLRNYPKTRDNDRILIGGVYAIYYGVDVNDSFKNILLREDLPSFESIRRCRQKIQAQDETLRGNRDKERIEAQKVYLDYVRSED